MAEVGSTDELEPHVRAAQHGDRRALELVVRAIQDQVYRLALRMLGNPSDAADAAQEALIRVVTGISTYRGDSAFRTWVYRVASNHLLNVRKKRGQERAMTFEDLGAALEAGLAAAEPRDRADPVVVEEARLVCTQAMLQCLDADHRLAYLLGEVMELPSAVGAAVLEITDGAFRKRLERARSEMEAFVGRRCGIVNESSNCRCAKQVGPLVAGGLIDPARLVLSRHAAVDTTLRLIDRAKSAAELMRSHPEYVAPDAFAQAMRQILGVLNTSS